MKLSRKILIIDDVPREAKRLASELERRGFLVQVLSDGELALEVIANELPFLVICDLEMPGMGGMEVMERIAVNPKTRDIAVILVHPTWTPENFSRSTPSGRTADCHLNKPFRPLEVASFAQRLWQGAERQNETAAA